LIRKNSLFHDTPKGATASAIICSIIETAKAAGLDAENYLDHLLSEMPGRLNDPDGIEDLFPWSDTVQKKCVRKSI
ncbi:transposase domain-containing protein, partial [Ohessyouella blattaphilus]|uniref:transposase domain-containing protein n=1 Tax=Ohessyouella blattaphilus TaxID=2949333 RepID=UPI003E2AFF9F